MSASNEWDEWHLTPEGWIQGSEKVDFAGVTERPTPEARIATFRHCSYMGSIHSKVQITWDEQWRREGVDLEPLYAKFGKYPKSVDATKLK
jgi:hypothetical protein